LITEFKKLVEDLKPFVREVSNKTADKAIIDMARNLASALSESGIKYENYFRDYRADKIFDPGCLLKTQPNIFDSVTPDYLEFCQTMFSLRPVGLGTPNAMVGEGEFMSIFSSPRVGISKKKNCGDITVDDKTVEMKGSELRIMGKVTGKVVQKHAQSLAKIYNIKPNPAKGNRTAFEPWDPSDSLGKATHWISQFKVLGVEKSCAYLNELCSSFIICEAKDFKVCFDDKKVFKPIELQKVILKKLFAAMDKRWDAFTVIDNNKITCLDKDEKRFDKLVESGEVVVSGSYFRSFQDTNVGLYIQLI
jgi:hypothetical protein